MRGGYFHGGPRGLAKILPPSITGARSTGDYTGARHVHNQDCIYVTTDMNAALMYAAAFDHGCVYEVEPEGIEPDPDCSQPGLSFACTSAAIVRVHRVRGKTLRQVRRLLLTEAA